MRLNGADAWALQDVIALGVTAGAPPDEFNQLGQEGHSRHCGRTGWMSRSIGPFAH